MAYVYYYSTYYTPVEYYYPCSPPAFSYYEPVTYSVIPSSRPRRSYSRHKRLPDRTREPEEGHCFLLFFKEKYWDELKCRFGPNSNYVINTPDSVIRQFMRDHPRMVSSRRDLQRYRTGPYLTHIAPGGHHSPWELA
ncbi:unnamed protein product [Clonostachys rosea]|uniref:Uncharacterized protein n=1 Tax=Bionectria ochroleuca TaxID=29856 RepID=A0ABY6UKZ8_BIOOC|nr:unnamed protein product [Clonostachys rosea]